MGDLHGMNAYHVAGRREAWSRSTDEDAGGRAFLPIGRLSPQRQHRNRYTPKSLNEMPINMSKPKLLWGLLYASALTIVCYLGLNNQLRINDAWFLSGNAPDDYALEVVSDQAIRFYAQALEPEGFATAMRRMEAHGLRGKRVRMTGYVTTNNIAKDAALWMRVDGPEGQMLAMDNMDDRLITSNVEKQRCEIVLDVPAQSRYIAYGVILGGGGELYLEDVRIEAVKENVPTTNLLNGV